MDHVGNKIVTLANGLEARIRPVSPHVRQGLYLRVQEEIEPKPEMPEKEVKSVDGHVEYTPVEEGDPEYEEWKREYTTWDRRTSKAKSKIHQENLLRIVAYVVTGWRRKRRGILRLFQLLLSRWCWSISPPRGWKPDPIIRTPPDIDTCGIYKLTEVVSDDSDYYVIQYAAFDTAREPITQEEVGRQLDGFPRDG